MLGVDPPFQSDECTLSDYINLPIINQQSL